MVFRFIVKDTLYIYSKTLWYSSKGMKTSCKDFYLKVSGGSTLNYTQSETPFEQKKQQQQPNNKITYRSFEKHSY